MHHTRASIKCENSDCEDKLRLRRVFVRSRRDKATCHFIFGFFLSFIWLSLSLTSFLLREKAAAGGEDEPRDRGGNFKTLEKTVVSLSSRTFRPFHHFWSIIILAASDEFGDLFGRQLDRTCRLNEFLEMNVSTSFSFHIFFFFYMFFFSSAQSPPPLRFSLVDIFWHD